MDFKRNTMVNSGTNIKFKLFDNCDQLYYGMSTRRDGSMKLRSNTAQAAHTENRSTYFSSVGLSPRRVVSAGIAHGTKIQIVSGSDIGNVIPNVDGLITNDTSITLSVTVADCFSIFFYAQDVSTVGIVHAGWRSLLGGILRNTVSTFQKNFKADPNELLVGVGPGIHECHFEVGTKIANLFADYECTALSKNGKNSIDLKKVILRQLDLVGTRTSNIEVHQECTFCEDKKYYSYRRLRSSHIKAMIAYMGLLKKNI